MGLPALPRVRPVVTAFAAALALHAGVLAFLLAGGAAPGLPDGMRSPVVEVVTQERAAEMAGTAAEPPRPEAEEGSPPESRDDVPAARRPDPTTFDVVHLPTDSTAPPVVSSPASDTAVPAGNERAARKTVPETVEPPPEPRPRPRAQARADTGRKANRRSDGKARPGERRPASKADKPDAPADAASAASSVSRKASLGFGAGEDRMFPDSMRGALVGLLQRQVERCYVPPADAHRGIVLPVIGMRLERSGALVAKPRVVRAGLAPADASLAQAALKAVRQCAPYSIPARFAPYYDEWKDIAAEFEFGG